MLALERLRLKWRAAGLRESELHVVSSDDSSIPAEFPEVAQRINGWGEAFHVRDGKIVHFQILGKVPAKLDDEIDLFLRARGNV
jgi:hypothetical protein